MTSSGSGGRYYWCLRHHRVESDADACPAKYQLGPYSSAEEAARGLERVRERNEQWEAEDARWSGSGEDN